MELKVRGYQKERKKERKKDCKKKERKKEMKRNKKEKNRGTKTEKKWCLNLFENSNERVKV